MTERALGPVWLALAGEETPGDGPLAGCTVGVKDNIDVRGLPTTAGCPSFAYEPEADAVAVARLRVAGASIVGKTSLDQFATGLVGTRTPHGVPESAIAPGCIPGGSSSGSAVAVARGEVDLALGTDTAGSGRVPAACCGVVGLKPTFGRIPVDGVVPACPSFDCVTVFARTVGAAARAIETMADDVPPTPPVRRIGVPSAELVASHCGSSVALGFAAAIDRARECGFEVVDVEVDAYLEAGTLLYGGAFVAERYASVGEFVDAHFADVDATVGKIISAARDITAVDYVRDRTRLDALARQANRVWKVVDGVLLPTIPSHPTIAEALADPIGVNARLGTFTAGCNLVGWCAAAVPIAGVGVSLFGAPHHDRSVWSAAAALHGERLDPPARARLAVCGAHLSGEPLNWQLTSRSASLVSSTTTAPSYRLAALDTEPAKPGLTRCANGGVSIEVEVWELGFAEFGSFVDAVPPPLCIGTVELADGSWVNGFLCEGHAAERATDISSFGGWRAWGRR